MVIYEDFNRLVSLSQQLADLVESLSDKVENLESIARYQENQINTPSGRGFAIKRDCRYLVKAHQGP